MDAGIVVPGTGAVTMLFGSLAWIWVLDNAVAHGLSWELQSEPWHLRLTALPSSPPEPPPSPKGQHAMSHCKDATTGKFWYFGRDSTGAAFACPIDELPDTGNWATYGAIEDAVNGPLVPVDHAVLQAMYDVRGRPTEGAGVGKHRHDFDIVSSTGDPIP